MAQAAILDVDGTLVDTNYQHALAWYRAFRQHGIIIPVWKLHRAIGMGGDQLVRELTSVELDEQQGELLRATEQILFRELIHECEPLPGARELIEELKKRGHQVVLASSANTRDLQHHLAKLGARELADGWTTADDVEASKPAPDIVNAAMEKAETKEAVMIGDSRWDVEAAKRAGVPTIGVLTGGFSESELRAAGAACVFEELDQLRAALDSTPLGAA